VKVLLDENLPHRLRSRLGSHEAFTVSYMGWAGLKNGESNALPPFREGNGREQHEFVAIWRMRRATKSHGLFPCEQ
jgi:hypothetical protein